MSSVHKIFLQDLYETSSDDSDYVPGSDDESDEEYTDDMTYTEDSTNRTSPRESKETLSQRSTYMQALSHAKKNNLSTFTYTPISGPHKNTVQTYERQVGKTNLVY